MTCTARPGALDGATRQVDPHVAELPLSTHPSDRRCGGALGGRERERAVPPFRRTKRLDAEIADQVHAVAIEHRADEEREDATVRRCMGFARSLGFGGLEVVNLYAYVATDPAELRRAGYPVGRGNDGHIEDAVRECERVVLAWGVHAARLERPRKVLALLGRMGVAPWCLRLTAGGHPEHPLRLPVGCELLPFEAEVGKVE